MTLHGLSQWRETDPKVLKEFLSTFHVIRDVHEILKFSRETFHAFFGMLSSDKYESVHDNVFRAILHTISLLHDRNVKTARQVLKSYINDIFEESSVYVRLLQLATKLLTNAKASGDVPETVRLLCSGLHSLFKFIARARALNAQTTKPVSDEKTYKAEVQKVGLLLFSCSSPASALCSGGLFSYISSDLRDVAVVMMCCEPTHRCSWRLVVWLRWSRSQRR